MRKLEKILVKISAFNRLFILHRFPCHSIHPQRFWIWKIAAWITQPKPWREVSHGPILRSFCLLKLRRCLTVQKSYFSSARRCSTVLFLHEKTTFVYFRLYTERISGNILACAKSMPVPLLQLEKNSFHFCTLLPPIQGQKNRNI